VCQYHVGQAQQAELQGEKRLDIPKCQRMCQIRYFTGWDMSKVYLTDLLAADDTSGIYYFLQGCKISGDH